jgi:hypothetical protein
MRPRPLSPFPRPRKRLVRISRAPAAIRPCCGPCSSTRALIILCNAPTLAHGAPAASQFNTTTPPPPLPPLPRPLLRRLCAAVALEDRYGDMTVEQFLRAFLSDMAAKCNEAVDDALDAVSLNHKRLREEVQEARHVQREAALLTAAAAAAVSAPAGRGRAKTKAGEPSLGVAACALSSEVPGVASVPGRGGGMLCRCLRVDFAYAHCVAGWVCLFNLAWLRRIPAPAPARGAPSWRAPSPAPLGPCLVVQRLATTIPPPLLPRRPACSLAAAGGAVASVRDTTARWQVRLTVTDTAEGCDDVVGASFLVTPQPADGHGSGMVKLGRSSGSDFGVSLPRDYSVSTWHGKVSPGGGPPPPRAPQRRQIYSAAPILPQLTLVLGAVYYSDLNTKNGSRING